MTLRLRGAGAKLLGDRLLGPLDLELSPGSLTVLLGPVGAGKTSLLRLMAGLERPGWGEVLLDDRKIHTVPPRERRVGLVRQRFVNYPTQTVFENLATPLRRAGTDPDATERRVREVAEMLHLEPFLSRLPEQLSGGQQQRTAIGRALVRDGGLLLLDEPLVNLDYKLREELREELRGVFARGESTIAYATSDPSEALMLGGRTVVMDHGKILQVGDALEVYRRPAFRRVGELTGLPAMNFVVGRLEGDALSLGGNPGRPAALIQAPAHIAALPAGSYRIGVRPHRLHFERVHRNDFRLEGQVSLAELSGSETFIHLNLTRAQDTPWVIHRAGLEAHEPGEALPFFVDPSALYAFLPNGPLAAAPPS